MKVLVPGHRYKLDTKFGNFEYLQFFKDIPESEEVKDGVLCQEVIRALINRYIYLFNQMPCQETTQIIIKLRECLKIAEVRAFGKTLDKVCKKTGLNIEEIPVMSNGHLYEPVNDLEIPF